MARNSGAFKLVLVAVLTHLFFCSHVQANTKFDPGLAAFAVSAKGRTLSHNIAFRTLLPGEKLLITAVKNFTIHDKEKQLASAVNRWEWTAPKQPGHTRLRIIDAASEKEITLEVFTLRPASEIKNGKLHGYQIGNYPPPLKGLEVYKAPTGYIEVSQELSNVKISPHFTLGQFLCKQQSAFPKFLVLRPKLLEKLEFLLQDVNDRGIATDSFVIMSGYRTPHYNRTIGNVANSRHIYGGAADIYIDVNPVDDIMDDINKDGKADLEDATLLYNIADAYVNKSGKTDLLGGVGKYKQNAVHGPFVHVDVRGNVARWGH